MVFQKIHVFIDKILDWQWNELLTWTLSPEGERFKITKEGGFAIRLLNKTGAPTVKGELTQVSVDADEALTIASDPYAVQGPWYTSGVEDGESGFVVVSGMADVLLEDSTPANRSHWVRLSRVTPGRADATFDRPGIEVVGDSVVYTKGSTISGTIADTATDDGNYLEIGEATGAPGIDAAIEFSTRELLSSVLLDGYYTGNHVDSVSAYAYDYVLADWGPNVLFTLSRNGTENEELTYIDLSSDHFDEINGKMKIRFLHPDSGNTNHRLWIDKLVLSAPMSAEHFKEIGHCLQNVDSGTDKLARINLHIL